EAARRTKCQNNMRQVAIGLHNHHDTYGYFPHGLYDHIDTTTATSPPYHGTQNRRCWAHDLMPFVEQMPLYEKFDAHMTKTGRALAFKNLQVPVLTYVCPSDPNSPKFDTFWGGEGTEDQGF